MERTFVMVKPDGVQRGLAGEVLSRIEKRGFKIAGLKMLQIEQALAEKHYGEHKEKPFFKDLVNYITSGPVMAMVIEGRNVITTVREMMGATNPAKALPGTVRGTYAVEIGRNIVHSSDSAESAQREINLFFSPNEILDWDRSIDCWIYE